MLLRVVPTETRAHASSSLHVHAGLGFVLVQVVLKWKHFCQSYSAGQHRFCVFYKVVQSKFYFEGSLNKT